MCHDVVLLEHLLSAGVVHVEKYLHFDGLEAAGLFVGEQLDAVADELVDVIVCERSFYGKSIGGVDDYCFHRG